MSDDTTIHLPGCGCLTLVLTAIAGLLFLILLKLCGVGLWNLATSIGMWVGGITLGILAAAAGALAMTWVINKYSRWQNKRFRDKARRL